MKACSHCKEELEKTAKKCPNCGSLVERNQSRKILSWVLGSIFLFWGIEGLATSGDILVGALFLLGGVLILPPVYKNFTGKPKLATPVTVLTVAIFVALVAITIMRALNA